jgi:aspartate racemase
MSKPASAAAESASQSRWGIVGGMGPRASAAFLTSIYAQATVSKEQDLPIVYMLSDPTLPDRTPLLLQGRQEVLAKRLANDIERLVGLGATDIIVCCITLHQVVPMLPLPLRRRVRSLVEIIIGEVAARKNMQLLLCTEGTRRMDIFPAHPLWQRAAPYVMWPDPGDQRAIHAMIYDVKGGGSRPDHRMAIRELTRRYHVGSVIAGCTEMHTVLDDVFVRERPSVRVVDPLAILATQIRTAIGEGAVGAGGTR